MKGKLYQKISTLFVLLFVLIGCSANEGENLSDQQKKNRQLVLAIGGEPEDGFDPTTGWGRYGSPLFQSTLFTFDKDLQAIPEVAKDYEISDDGHIWTVSLRDDIVFSDEVHLTAKDVVFTYETAKESSSIVDLSNLESVEAIDSYTVKFTLKEPQSTFLYLLIATGIVPEHLYDENYREHPIGSGPYKFVQWDKGQQLIVEKNPHYYGQEPYFDQLTFLFLNEDAAFSAAKAGEVDIVSVPPLFAKESIEGMELKVFDSVDNRGVMFPYQPSGETTENGDPIGNDVTADLAIRIAINQAVDREALVEGILEGYGTPAYSIADQLPWWNEDTVIPDNDLVGAIELLEASGWIENKEGIREKDGLLAEFSLIYPSGDQLRQSLAMAFAEQMKSLGISVHTEGKSWSEIEHTMYSTPILMGWGSHDPLEMYYTHYSGLSGQGFNNPNFYLNETVDHYMEQALRAKTEEEANEYWKKAQWDGETGFSALGDAPWAWLVNLQHLYFVRNDLEIGEPKIQPHGHGWPITDFIEEWHWKD